MILRAVDSILAALCAAAAVPFIVARARFSDRTETTTPGPKLLVIDAAYSLKTMRGRDLLYALRSRDLDGHFAQVFSVHPLLGAAPEDAPDRFGSLRVHDPVPGHTVIEAPVGRFMKLGGLPLTNFVLGQIALFLFMLALARSERIDAVRVGDPYFQGLIGFALSRLARMPLVVRVNGNYDAIYEATGRLAYPRIFRIRRIEKIVDRFVLSRAHLVIAPNENNMEYALANGARRERSAVVRYGSLIHPAHFEDPSARAPVGEELGIGRAPYLLFVGRLEPVKRPGDVLEVLQRIEPHHSEVRLMFVGDGSMRTDLETRARSKSLEDRVIFAGARDQIWIARAIAGASVVLAPMLGRALVESALGAAAIVAYDVDWHAELIEDGRSGRLVPFRDVAAMAGATDEILSDKDRAKLLGSGARDRALAEMNPDSIVGAERALYESLLGRAAATV